jgi:hypothetical protein
MTPDPDLSPERAYPYRSGCVVMGCGVVMFGIMGGVGAALMPFGWEQLRNGQMPLGVALLVISLFTTPMILLALLALGSAIRDTTRPPLLRVTPTSLLLPVSLRDVRPEQEKQDERGEPKDPDPTPAHPEEIPFAAIRWVRRESKVNPGSDRLLIVHDLAPTTLIVEQYMMRREDFDELETVLRAAIPAAFAPAPPT